MKFLNPRNLKKLTILTNDISRGVQGQRRRTSSSSIPDPITHLNHIEIGKRQNLFFFNDVAPGACFFTHFGTRIYNTLLDFVQLELKKYKILPVMTPNIFKTKLWSNGANLENNGKCLYEFLVKNERYGVKHVNNHANCLIFNHEWDVKNMTVCSSQYRSWREMPCKFVDFGVLHQYYPQNTKNTLLTSRRFQRDDQHIFTSFETLHTEVHNFLKLACHIYNVLGLKYKFEYTHNQDLDNYEEIEVIILKCLDELDLNYIINNTEDKSCGPKLLINVENNLGQCYQTGFIHFDLDIVELFKLRYVSIETHAPIYMNSSIIGSFESLLAILSEHFRGEWPLWLSPRPVLIITDELNTDNANLLRSKIVEQNILCDIAIQPLDLPLTKTNNYTISLVLDRIKPESVTVYDSNFKMSTSVLINELISSLKYINGRKLLTTDYIFN